MSEDLNLSKDFLENAKNQPAPNFKKKKVAIRWAITAVLAVVIIGAFIFAMTKWFAPTDFSERISLDKQISRWDNLSWGATGNFEKDNVDTKFGNWAFDDTNGIFTGEGDYASCSFYFNKLKNPEANQGSDRVETKNYINNVFKGTEILDEDTVWVDFKKDNKVVTEVELTRTDFIDPEGKYTASYNRVSPMNGIILFGTVRCDTSELLEEVIPKDSDTQLEDLGIWLNAN